MTPILVTGGAKGLGAQICRQLASKGHDVLIHYLTSKVEAEEIAAHCRLYGVQAEVILGDFSYESAYQSFIEELLMRFKTIKGLVNNVGNYLMAPLAKTGEEEWHALFQTNFFAPIFLTKALLPSICEQKGTIINIGTSGLYPVKALTQAPAYAASKSAFWFYTRTLAKEMAPYLVSVNMVSPSYMENSVDLPAVESLPMKRPVLLQEVAHVVAFLFEESSHVITGQNIEVTGGVGL